MNKKKKVRIICTLLIILAIITLGFVYRYNLLILIANYRSQALGMKLTTIWASDDITPITVTNVENDWTYTDSIVGDHVTVHEIPNSNRKEIDYYIKEWKIPQEFSGYSVSFNNFKPELKPLINKELLQPFSSASVNGVYTNGKSFYELRKDLTIKYYWTEDKYYYDTELDPAEYDPNDLVEEDFFYNVYKQVCVYATYQPYEPRPYLNELNYNIPGGLEGYTYGGITKVTLAKIQAGTYYESKSQSSNGKDNDNEANTE